MNLEGEVIVADNSTDRTAEIARSLGAQVITPLNPGYGSAYLEAFPHARGSILAIADADGTYNLSEIPRLLVPLIKGEAELVIGSRFKGSIIDGSMPVLHQYIGNPLFTLMINILFGTRISDSHSGMRAFSRGALQKMKLKGKGMEFATEMIIEAALNGLTIKEVPISYSPRKGKSKLHSFRDGWRHLWLIFQYRTFSFIVGGILVFLFLFASITFLF
jgi:glycosyltransferase involved in cell wall biosynthesis